MTGRSFAVGLTALPLALAPVLSACGGGSGASTDGGAAVADLADAYVPRAERMERDLGILAADSMEGRRAGTAGERRARDFLVRELERFGVEPAGEDGYLQAVPVVRVASRGPRERWSLPGPDVVADTAPGSRATAWNVLGLVPGTDPELAGQVVIVGAHYDHVGVGRPVDGDSIYNGADDDGSGTIAALEIARALATAPPGEGPGRTVLVALFSAEEMGLLGPRWFLRAPTVDLDSIVADLQIEMIGRPDSLVGGPGRAWLTGYERSTVGELLAEAGSPIVADPRPEARFFFRSDNIPFARAGIPAHTLSSYGLHRDYHTPDDEVEAVDFAHMETVVRAAVTMVRELARGPRPEWVEGGRPTGR